MIASKNKANLFVFLPTKNRKRTATVAKYTTMFVIVVYKTRFSDILLQFSSQINTISVTKLHNGKNSGTQFCQQNIASSETIAKKNFKSKR